MISPETLRRYPHFAGVSSACLKEVAMISEEHTFSAGDRLFEESSSFKAEDRIYEKGKEAEHLMILTEGEVDITYRLGTGQETIVGTAIAGQLLGFSALIPPHQLTAAGIAKTDGALIAIPAPELRALCEANPDLGYRLMTAVAMTVKERLTDTRVLLAGAIS